MEMQSVLVKAAKRTLTLIGRRRSIYLADKFPNYDIGEHSYGDLALFVYSATDGKLHIGKYCSFAAEAKIFLGGEHRTDWISTYPFNVLDPAFSHIKGHPRSKGDVSIGNDVWVGRGATIMSGVTVGNGAAIGAYSVVTKDIPDYAIMGGNPAKLLRMRFPPPIVERLQEIRWWDWPNERVRRAVPYLQSANVNEFLQRVEDGAL
jgi:acetyltransferase-like isoleucine patch superfamily enzyme